MPDMHKGRLNPGNTWDKYKYTIPCVTRDMGQVHVYKVQLISVSVDSVVRAKHESHLYWPVLFHLLVIMGDPVSAFH